MPKSYFPHAQAIIDSGIKESPTTSNIIELRKNLGANESTGNDERTR